VNAVGKASIAPGGALFSSGCRPHGLAPEATASHRRAVHTMAGRARWREKSRLGGFHPGSRGSGNLRRGSGQGMAGKMPAGQPASFGVAQVRGWRARCPPDSRQDAGATTRRCVWRRHPAGCLGGVPPPGGVLWLGSAQWVLSRTRAATPAQMSTAPSARFQQTRSLRKRAPTMVLMTMPTLRPAAMWVTLPCRRASMMRK